MMEEQEPCLRSLYMAWFEAYRRASLRGSPERLEETTQRLVSLRRRPGMPLVGPTKLHLWGPHGSARSAVYALPSPAPFRKNDWLVFVRIQKTASKTLIGMMMGLLVADLGTDRAPPSVGRVSSTCFEGAFGTSDVPSVSELHSAGANRTDRPIIFDAGTAVLPILGETKRVLLSRMPDTYPAFELRRASSCTVPSW